MLWILVIDSGSPGIGVGVRVARYQFSIIFSVSSLGYTIIEGHVKVEGLTRLGSHLYVGEDGVFTGRGSRIVGVTLVCGGFHELDNVLTVIGISCVGEFGGRS